MYQEDNDYVNNASLIRYVCYSVHHFYITDSEFIFVVDYLSYNYNEY